MPYIPAPSEEPPHPLLQGYVEALDQSLTGQLPSSSRRAIVQETLFILSSTVREQCWAGRDMDSAVARAIDELGSPESLAALHIEGLFEVDVKRSQVLKMIGRSNSIAFGVFGCATLAYLALVLVRVYVPGHAPVGLPYDPAVLRAYFPAPLPFPEANLSFLLAIGYPILAPAPLGWLVGRRIPVRAASAVCRALMPCIISSFLVGAMLLPTTDGLVFALVQALFWLPIACLFAHLSSRQARVDRAQTTAGADLCAPFKLSSPEEPNHAIIS